jgi:3-hydroxyisobutyrate dehydrogenase
MANVRSGTPSLSSVAFLGLGKMGAPMAANLAKKGFSLRVYNRAHARVEAFVREHGALDVRASTSPRACVKGAGFVVTMVSDGAALEAILGTERGMLAGLEKDAVVIDMSTIGRAAALRAAMQVKAAGGRFVDAPVSGTVGPAARGELLALVGASLADLARARPLLDAMCTRILHAGEVGQGSALKVVLNGVGAHHVVAFTSMLVLGERAQLPREVILEALTSGAFSTPVYVGKKTKVLARDYSPEFTLAHTLKDSSLAAELEQETGLRLPVLGEILRELEEAVREGLGDEDLYALEKHFVAQ